MPWTLHLDATVALLLTGFSSRTIASRENKIRKDKSRSGNVAFIDCKRIPKRTCHPTTALKCFSIVYSAAGAIYPSERYAFLCHAIPAMLYALRRSECYSHSRSSKAMLYPFPISKRHAINANLPRYASDTLHAK